MRCALIFSVLLLTPGVLFSAPTVFRGQVVFPGGQTARGVEVSAVDYISLLNTAPWNWGPGWKIRGTAKTDRSGRFVLHSSARRPAELWFDAEGVLEVISQPDPQKFHRVVVGQTKITMITTTYGKPPKKETRSLSKRKRP